MTQTPDATRSVPHSIRDTIDMYVQLFRELAGDNVKALTLYGAVASDSFKPERQAVRNVAVLGKVDLDLLRKIANNGTKLGKANIAAPLIMTADYIASSLDTFPLEFIEICQTSINLFGDDHFADLTFEPTHIRLQCERELKTTLIGLRQGLLAAAGKEKMLGTLEMGVAEGLLRTLRGLLWLKGDTAAKPSDQVVTAIESLADKKLPGLRAALDTASQHGWAEFETLYRDVESIGEYVDAL